MDKNNRIITIVNCKSIQLNGVEHIVGFDEKCIVLSTDSGRVVIEGSNLKVDSLTKSDGELVVIGEFSGLYFSKEKKAQSFFEKFLK